MTPGSGIQTLYNNDPPEAVVDPATESVVPSPSQGVTPYSRRKRVSITILTVVLIAAILGIGLGLGLRQRGKKKLGDTSTLASTFATLSVRKY